MGQKTQEQTQEKRRTTAVSRGRRRGPAAAKPRLRDGIETIRLQEVLSFLRSLPATVFQVERHGETFYWRFYEGQLAQESGFRSKNMRGHDLVDVQPPSLPEDLPTRLERAFHGDFQKEVYKDGDRYLKLYLQRGFDEKGDPTGVVDGAVTDVTQRVQAEERQKRLYTEVSDRNTRLDKARMHTEQLNYILSHDLRNPLTVIFSMCEVLRRELEPGDPRHVEWVDRIQRSAGRINDMLSDILKLSRSERVPLTRIEVDVTAMAKRLLGQFAQSDPARHVETRIDDGLTVYADNNLMHEVMENLLSNAWKYTEEKDHARIRVTRSRMDGRDWICVEDNGVGFDEKEKEVLFEPFTRTDSGQRFKGIGVGLAVVRMVIKRHGGEVNASGTPGEGARFCFTLPAKREASSEAATGTAEDGAEGEPGTASTS